MEGPRTQPTDPGHRQLVQGLEELVGHGPLTPDGPDPAGSHTTSGRPFYRIPVPDERRLARQWLSEHSTWSAEQLYRTVQSLLAGPSYEEKTLGCVIVKERREVRQQVSPGHVMSWLDDLRGWAEVDSLCQSVFPAEQLLSDWAAWRSAIVTLSTSDNANKRRASLVLLTGPVRRSSDERLAQLAITTVDTARPDRDPLVTKAVSWLLRDLVANHRLIVAEYLDRHASELAPLVVRETRTKLRTGTKSGR